VSAAGHTPEGIAHAAAVLRRCGCEDCRAVAESHAGLLAACEAAEVLAQHVADQEHAIEWVRLALSDLANICRAAIAKARVTP
jgi:hypothetical protein